MPMKRVAIPLNQKKYKRFMNYLPPLYRTLWNVMALSGLRLSDALRLRKSDITRGWVIESKTKKRKSLVFHERDLDMLGYGPSTSHDNFLFPSPRKFSRHVTRQNAEYHFRKAAKAAGYRNPVNAHSARKLYAWKLYQETGDMIKVQKALNHDNIGVTAIYLFVAPKE